MKVSQFVAGMSVGDAITNYVFSLDEMMQSWGLETGIYYIDQHVPVALKSKGKPYQEYDEDSSEENVVILHFANGSEIAPYIQKLKDKKIMIYHNITPSHYFNAISKGRVVVQEKGREQLKSLVGTFDLSLGVSEYNRSELKELGFSNTGVVPLTLDESILNVPPSQKVFNENRDGLKNIICVGRIAPNKRIEDVFRLMHFFQKMCEHNSRLFLLGSFGGMERYKMYLMNLERELNLKRVVWCGHISQEDLVAYYRIADVFLTMSEHEGFCMPLLEAMRFDCPVMARSTSAIGETLGGAGVLFYGKNYYNASELLHEVIENNELREKIIKRQKERILDFKFEKIDKIWKNWLTPFIG